MNNLALLDEVVIPVTIDYLEEDRIYQVSCLWLPGAHAWGESLDEAMQAIPDTIRAMVEAYREKGSALPIQLESLDLDSPLTLRVVPG